ncbi:receptor-like serine/threonine-protein kinase SD1-8 isoform X2 [Tripterygium wilfordii]|uniref:receptor-like serine/threonine-protein kinase SD1-8 isoform X2 n=1 Tax=Tripterygium wilfordii TaxID=458696 RepID=UPI0018F7F20C|nr:receptor-like serine/threonine-protein kinase SD1-8 isoform X2 [Tripterygium wilfordii]
MSSQRDTKVWVFVFFSCLFIQPSIHAKDSLGPGETLYYNQTLVSAGDVFELGFFSFTGWENQYLGVWFKDDKERKPVWVANRDNHILDSSDYLSIRRDGNLVIVEESSANWIINTGSLSTTNNTRAKILDTGNLVLLDEDDDGKIIWQSFDCPTDTYLPGMKIGYIFSDPNNKKSWYILSWSSPSVPSSGTYTFGVDRFNKSLFNVWRRGTGVYQPVGLWDGSSFKFFFQNSSEGFNFSLVAKPEQAYLTFNDIGNNTSAWFGLDSNGDIIEYRKSQEGITRASHSPCDTTNFLGIKSQGCLIPRPSMCDAGDGFFEHRGVMQISSIARVSAIVGYGDCELICKNNCSCTAYSSVDNGGSCEFYYGDMNDLLSKIRTGNSSIYVRENAPETSDNGRKRKLLVAIIVPVTVVSSTVFCLIFWFYYVQRRKHNFLDATLDSNNVNEFDTKNDCDDLPEFSFSRIEAATNQFSYQNKLGEGGFGSVYKGMLFGNEIAVKRLSKYSGQGQQEFKNEVQLISKLQHRNLVNLIGYCVRGEEKILIYEYMPNKSLDSFIFDPSKQHLLDWRKRLHIVEGIAQGLLYLHKYSRLKIIHRDMKTSNILLDAYMNPKISDFGMARICCDNQSGTKTSRIVGTYGYMSPEYALHGLFSTKSDVFSFGVILLEIVSGRRNTAFNDPDSNLNLLGYAWEVWKDGRFMELLHPGLVESSSKSEVSLCIQIGLLCSQEKADDRPTMSDVVSFLSNKEESLPTPKQPGFYALLNLVGAGSSRRRREQSLNTVSFSGIDGR